MHGFSIRLIFYLASYPRKLDLAINSLNYLPRRAIRPVGHNTPRRAIRLVGHKARVSTVHEHSLAQQFTSLRSLNSSRAFARSILASKALILLDTRSLSCLPHKDHSSIIDYYIRLYSPVTPAFGLFICSLL